jgi:catechol 2,3-dioxygenase-like lactoylglutathione lyase family enzyme
MSAVGPTFLSSGELMIRRTLAQGSVSLAAALAAPCVALWITAIVGAQEGARRPPITGVASFAVNVADLAAARSFYSGVLGLDEAFTIKNPTGGSELITFKINERQYVYVAPDLKDPGASRLLFVGFETADAKGLRTYLASKGVEVPAAVEPDAEGNLSLFVKDPEGNSIQFIQYQASSVHGRSAGKFISRRALSDHALHVGYRISDPAKLDAFYKDILGYRLIWKGGSRDDRFDWISMAVPDGNQWIEYMVNTGTPSIRQLGVLNHLALGTLDIDAAHTQIVERGYTDKAVPSIGRDGRWLMHLYDKDLTRTEFMIRKPVREPCCFPLTDVADK